MKGHLDLWCVRNDKLKVNMGLDMYLYVRKYESVSKWRNTENANNFYPKELEGLGKEILERNFMSKTTEYQVGYWRKANAIHKWFVDNCGNGEDNCQTMYVSREQLKGLLKLVNDTLEHKEKAKDNLPTQEGFFFGTYEYDEWYFQDLEYTKEIIEKVLKFVEENDKYDILYEASW